jgi:hypothetical protein
MCYLGYKAGALCYSGYKEGCSSTLCAKSLEPELPGAVLLTHLFCKDALTHLIYLS